MAPGPARPPRGRAAVGSAGRRRASDADEPLRVRARASLGRALAFTGDTDAAHDVGGEAVARARLLGDDDLLAHALQASLWHGLRPTDVPAKLARATELSTLAHRTGNLGHLGPAAYYRGVIAYVQGDPDAWVQAQDDLVRMSQATGQDFFEYMAGCLDYGRHFVAGDFARRGGGLRRPAGPRASASAPTAPRVLRPSRPSCSGGRPAALERIRPLITGAGGPGRALGAGAAGPLHRAGARRGGGAAAALAARGRLGPPPGLRAVAGGPGLPRRGGAPPAGQRGCRAAPARAGGVRRPQPGRRAVRRAVRQRRPLPGRRGLPAGAGLRGRLAGLGPRAGPADAVHPCTRRTPSLRRTCTGGAPVPVGRSWTPWRAGPGGWPSRWGWPSPCARSAGTP